MCANTMEPYEANWESLKRYEVPEWFRNDKFGIFIHWGVYAVPAFQNEWYPNSMYVKGSATYEHHRKKWGDQKDFGYKDFIPMFKAEKWDPEAWVRLFQKAGARFVVPVAEHHDGFPMYDCAWTPWNAARMGPCRDVVGELGKATRAAGMKFGVSSHRAHQFRHFTFSDAFDTWNTQYSGLYGTPHPAEAPVTYEFVLDWYGRTCELVDRFSPDILWFDFGWHRDEFDPWRPRVAAYYYNHALEHGYEPVLQYKQKFPDGVAVLDVERGKLDKLHDYWWQTDTSISYRSWCYIEDDDFRTVDSIVHDLVDIVSKRGALLLNIGPRADGTIPGEVEERLLAVGKWLEANGEAIYDTRPWTSFGEGDTAIPQWFQEKTQQPYTAADLRFTTRKDALYVIALGHPTAQTVARTLGADSELKAEAIKGVSVLATGEQIEWSQDGAGLKLAAPKQATENACVFKVALK